MKKGRNNAGGEYRPVTYNKCPICHDTGYVFRPAGFRGNQVPQYTECAMGPPFHKAREI